MKLLYVGTYCSSQKFGFIFENSKIKPGQAVQKYHNLITKGLKEQGIDIEVMTALPITPKTNSEKFFAFKKESEKEIIFTYLPIFNLKLIKNIVVFIFSFLYTILFILRNKKDVVIVCDVLKISIVSGAVIAAKILGVEIVGIVTDVPTIRANKKITIAAKYNWWLIKAFTYYLFLTESMNEVINKTGKPYVVIEGQVDIDMQTKENNLLEKFDKKICMYTGGLQKIYGIEYLVKGFIKANVENSELHIYGTGDFEEDLIKICKKTNRVKYFGVVPNKEIVGKQLHATLLINPRPTNEEYTKYSFPSKNMEYMVSGTPTLTTKLPGMPKEYHPYVYLIEDETIEGVAGILKDILNKSPEELHEKGLMAKKFVLEYKNNVVQAQKIIEMLNYREGETNNV